jgi:hypothetical protein
MRNYSTSYLTLPVVGQIDKAWIIRRKYGYEYHLAYELKPGRT